MVPMAQWVGQQGSEALDSGLNRNIYPHFRNHGNLFAI